MPATLSHVSFSLAVTVVATREVVPCARDGRGNDFQRLARAFHHVVSPRSVNVDIDKARHNGFSARVDFAHAARQIDFPSLADGGNLAPLNHDDGIGNFFEWSECAVGVDDNRLHKDGIILLETRRNWESRCGEIFRAAFLGVCKHATRATFIHRQGSCFYEGGSATLCSGLAPATEVNQV